MSCLSEYLEVLHSLVEGAHDQSSKRSSVLRIRQVFYLQIFKQYLAI